jgi:hypothetical protein
METYVTPTVPLRSIVQGKNPRECKKFVQSTMLNFRTAY